MGDFSKFAQVLNPAPKQEHSGDERNSPDMEGFGVFYHHDEPGMNPVMV